jgi:hypothetical protein
VIVLAGWGAFLLVLAGVQLVFGPDAIELALQGGVGLAALGAGLALGLGPARAAGALGPRPLAAGSLGTALAAGGVALMAFGAEAGQWLVLLGAGVTLLGAGELARERRIERA